jgi:hypothetical protein
MVMFDNARLRSRFMALEQAEPTVGLRPVSLNALAKFRVMAQKSSVVEFVQCDDAYRLNANEMFIRAISVCLLPLTAIVTHVLTSL